MVKQMSKVGKLRAREQRRQAKIARKESRRRQWEAWMAAGVNQKQKKQKSKKLRLEKGSHPLGICGNIGCKRCNPTPYNLLPLWKLH